MKNHEMIGMNLSFDVEKWNSRCIEQFTADDYHVLNDAKEFAVTSHLGLIESDKVLEFVERGAVFAAEYLSSGRVREITGGWFSPLSRGILLALLSKRCELLPCICTWAKPSRKPEYKGSLPDEVQQIYLVLASQFQDPPSRGFRKLELKLRSSKKRSVKSLVDAVLAVIDRDNQAFEIAIQKCVKSHARRKKPEPDAYFMEDWLPIDANTIFLAGLEIGLADPNFPKEVMAYLMTPSSVGFD